MVTLFPFRSGPFPSSLDSSTTIHLVLQVAGQADVVHICDNGGASYVSRLKHKPVIVTCHDMLAVRGALGELPP